MKTIKLGGKYAVGAHEFAIVDDEDYERLAQWGWKAKPNQKRTNFYAIRTQMGEDGKMRDVRMHREVLGYSGPLDVDHENRNSLDNRRDNLRAVTRSVNTLNTEHVTHQFTCLQCGKEQTRTGPRSTRWGLYCSQSCSKAHRLPPQTTEPKPRQRYTCACTWCGITFDAGRADSKFCGERCKKADKWKRQKESGTLPPSAHGSLLALSVKGNRDPADSLVHTFQKG